MSYFAVSKKKKLQHAILNNSWNREGFNNHLNTFQKLCI